VALVPDAVSRLAGSGFEVVVEPGAGAAASFPDDAYAEAGASLDGSAWDAEGVAKVRKPTIDEVGRLSDGQILVGFLEPLTDPAGVERLADRGVHAFAMESIPRITRAQPMDALSSQATVSGYKAVLIAAGRLPRFFPMLMTAAGTVAPAKVLVLGAGVAGLQAIATAHRLGAVVSGFDVRPVVKEQVESLGATFLDLGIMGEETAEGYARELTESEQLRQQEELAARIPDYDVVITTALIPGRPAPRLIPADAVKQMRPGSVIVDLGAEAGGNCELTEPGEIVEREGVTLVGLTNVPSTMPFHASQLYARNVSALLQHLAPDGELALDWNDEITAGACVTRERVAACAATWKGQGETGRFPRSSSPTHAAISAARASERAQQKKGARGGNKV
jgi:NAD(P) transhydrogenase subunit alpha